MSLEIVLNMNNLKREVPRSTVGSGNPWIVFPDFEERRAFSTRLFFRDNEFRKNRWKVFLENSLKFTLVFTEYWLLYCGRRKSRDSVLSYRVPGMTNKSSVDTTLLRQFTHCFQREKRTYTLSAFVKGDLTLHFFALKKTTPKSPFTKAERVYYSF